MMPEEKIPGAQDDKPPTKQLILIRQREKTYEYL
jgi:hypothetical protein